MEAPTENKDVEEIPSEKLDALSCGVEGLLEELERSRCSPSLQRPDLDDWNLWIPLDTREYYDFIQKFSSWDALAAALIHTLEIEGGISDPSDRIRLSIVRYRAQLQSDMDCGHLNCNKEGTTSVNLELAPNSGKKPDYKGVPVAYCKEHFPIALDFSAYKELARRFAQTLPKKASFFSTMTSPGDHLSVRDRRLLTGAYSEISISAITMEKETKLA